MTKKVSNLEFRAIERYYDGYLKRSITLKEFQRLMKEMVRDYKQIGCTGGMIYEQFGRVLFYANFSDVAVVGMKIIRGTENKQKVIGTFIPCENSDGEQFVEWHLPLYANHCQNIWELPDVCNPLTDFENHTLRITFQYFTIEKPNADVLFLNPSKSPNE